MDWNIIDFSKLPSPCYVINVDILKNNLRAMKENCDFLGINPLISIKGFPLALIFKKMSPYVDGLSASSLFEARLGEHLGKELHIHTPAYRPDEILDVLTRCDHVIFNSFSQLSQYQNIVMSAPKPPSIGLRINPEYSEIKEDKYNPCLQYSRFGVTQEILGRYGVSDIDGFHLHVMYDQGAETLTRIIDILINKFGSYLPYLSWINLGGGQRLADDSYRIPSLKKNILKLTSEYGLKVYVEPCEAVITECGYLVSTVLDVIMNKKSTAILDTSASCHMPDVLETPYCPDVQYPLNNKDEKFDYLLAGVSCLAGDIIGDYKFGAPIQIGDKIVFSEMCAYTFAKENYFNGINHPAIVLYDQAQGFQIAKQFRYHDYESKYL